MDRVWGLQVFKPHRNAVRNKVTFVSPLQSTTCKTSTTEQKYICVQLSQSMENSTYLYIYWWAYWNMQGQNQRNSGVRACNPSLVSVIAEPTASETPAAGEAAHMTGVLHVGAPVGTGAWEAGAAGPRTLPPAADVPKDLPPVGNGRARTLPTPSMVEVTARRCSPPILLLLQSRADASGVPDTSESPASPRHSSSDRSTAVASPEAEGESRRRHSATPLTHGERCSQTRPEAAQPGGQSPRHGAA